MRILKLVMMVMFFVSFSVKAQYHFPKTPKPEEGVFLEPVNDIRQVYGELREPYFDLCRMIVERKKLFTSPENYSSGAYLGDGTIITAAHNIFSPSYNKVKGLYIQCGVGTRPNQTPIQQSANPSPIHVSLVNNGYRWRKFSKDVGFIKVCSLKEEESTFRLVTKEELANINSGDEIYVAGYPADKDSAEGFSSSRLIHIKTKIKGEPIAGKIVYSTDDTYGGMRGSPIWIVNGDKKSVIVGVHVATNRGYLFSEKMLDDYHLWIKSAKYSGACSS